jgi:hypothetical protein
MLYAAAAIEPALRDFYRQLSPTQKGQFDQLGR